MKNLLIALFFFSTTAAALDNKTYICTSGELQRIIEVQYPGEGDVPCAVVYTKDGASQTLWQALNESGYCETQASAFVDKQSSWGWQCEESSAATADDSSSMDTEVLGINAENLAEEDAATIEPVEPETTTAEAPIDMQIE